MKKYSDRGYCIYCNYQNVKDAPYCAMCGTRMTFSERGHPEISVHGTNADEVERVSKTLLSQLPESRRGPKQFPLVSGVFFLIAFIVVFGAILTAAKMLPLYVFPIVLIGGVLTFSVVSAFILRQDESLSEKGFLELMRLSFKYLPLLRKR